MEKTYNLYQNILKELGLFSIDDHHAYYKFFVAPIQTLRRYITFNNKHLVNIILANITNKNKDFTLSDIIFNPLNENLESCSMQFLNDEIHRYVSQIIYSKIIQNIIEKSNSKITIRKWQNILVVVRKKNLMNFSFSLKNQNKVYINFEYPLLNILKITTNNLCGIQLEKDEIDSFIKTYEEVTNQMFEGLLKNPIIVPEKSNQHQYLYTFIKFYTTIKEATLIKSQISRLRKKQRYNFLIQEINNLNDFNSYKLSEELNKLDHESYLKELQIRTESNPYLLLLKDSDMSKNKKPVKKEQDTKSNESFITIESFGEYIQVNKEEYDKKIAFLNFKKFEDNYQKMQNNEEWDEIFYLQRLVLNILKVNGGGLWFDTRIKKYCFRSKVGANIVYKSKDEISELLTRALQEKITNFLNQNNNGFLSSYAIEIVLVSKIKGINNHKLNTNKKASNIIKILVFENEIKTIDDDVFNINSTEFIKADNDLFYTRNRFIPTKHLSKIFPQTALPTTINYEESFIERFIYQLVKEDKVLSDYIMNWLAYYFQNLKKSKSALVFIGDKEVTQGIFWNIIIKEIFGKLYCSTVNDNEYESSLVSDIAQDKLFFNIDDINDADSQFDDNTMALIIKELLIKASVSDNENNQVEIHGQMIVTAVNPAPYLKKALSKCTVIETATMDTVLEKLDVEDETEFEDKVFEDLDNFSNTLLLYSVQENLAKNRIDTEARTRLKNSVTPNIDKNEIDNNIDAFIDAIKDKNLKYFQKVSGTKDKKGNDIYEQLEHAFNKDTGYFIGQDLYLYYSTIYEQKFKDNKSLMNKLKAKDEMFMQEVKTLKILDKDRKEKVLFQAYKTSKETGNKELYKIDNYKLAKDIVIPSGSTIISSQTNLNRFSFEDEQDIENCIKRTKEYQKQKTGTKK